MCSSSSCNRVGINPDIRARKRKASPLVAAGSGISIVLTAAAECQREEIVYRKIEDADEAMGLYLAWNRQDASPLVERFARTAKALFKNRDK
ncbi:hypothetical protein AV656_08130 [Bhargavaea cecembensis]|uniref:LysR substrate-binding domain-containing protein n=1 Tax=Bhargavaea cecembensis TaxID=394098 RepID=A0A165H5T2_9BACL|nr:LysR substrate-binding domain-containing protein [Bhargavaea cecembensis]KZE38859.1 hypothetical protein AV656_08130 [Bhargavaea cecembensis]